MRLSCQCIEGLTLVQRAVGLDRTQHRSTLDHVSGRVVEETDRPIVGAIESAALGHALLLLLSQAAEGPWITSTGKVVATGQVLDGALGMVALDPVDGWTVWSSPEHGIPAARATRPASATASGAHGRIRARAR
ncbi:MAG: hypothetical protein HY319_03870 [Armatimonadetes bacterium]|nr:hypothetical protein [Armatimonadota bacterium]